MSKMTKKDYELVAGTFKVYKDYQIKDDKQDLTPEESETIELVHKELAEALATTLEQDNPRFDRDKFLEACGINQ